MLATAVASQVAKAGVDFLPLTVDYQEKSFAAGKIPGGFFKREGKPSEREVLNSRMIDRPVRPLFDDGFKNETQVIALVLSADPEVDPGRRSDEDQANREFDGHDLGHRHVREGAASAR